MNQVLKQLASHAGTTPDTPAVSDGITTLDYKGLLQAVKHLAERLNGRRIAFLLPNGCAWAVVDLAIQHRGVTAIPIPTFFSDSQIQHLLQDACPDQILTDQPERLAGLLSASPVNEYQVTGHSVSSFIPEAGNAPALPEATTKITYTSGTTGQPKGVCLGEQAIDRVTHSLSTAVQAEAGNRSLSLLPLSTLLENIGGLYAPLVTGSCACVPDLESIGLAGSSGVDPMALMTAMQRFAPQFVIAVPQLLKVMVETLEAGFPAPGSLRFLAVGGAPLAPTLIERARGLGLPVYQGYGLSEAASVVSLNLPGQDALDSVGKPLPHVQVRIAADGEIEVGGNLYNGYLGAGPVQPDFHATGDTGYLDDDGYLHITGRKKTTFATAYGRNVSPEWVESELTASGALLQAAVLGEGRPWNIGVLVPAPAASAPDIAGAIAAANQRLPDYARIGAWCIAEQPFGPHNGMTNATGALRREVIAEHYANQIEQLYEGELSHVRL